MSAVILSAPHHSPWRNPLLAFGAVVLALVLLYFDTVAAMVAIWSRSDTFAHAFLVPPISLWLVWRQRETLARLTPAPQPLVLLAMAGMAMLWLLAELVQVNAAMQFAWVAMLVLAVPAVLGWQVTWAILFPLLFLFFAVPIGEFMLPLMMAWTADFTVAALRLSGIPVFREGMQFVIPSGNWSVVEACSGVRYLIASFMVGTLFAYLNYSSWKRRALFMLVSILVPILANWLRAYMIVMLGHLSDNTIAVGVDHLLYGWVFFGVVIVLMFVVGARWSQPEAPSQVTAAGGTGAMPQLSTGWRPRRLLAAGLAALCLVSAPHLALRMLHQAENAASEARLSLPEQLAPGWSAVEASALAAYKPHFQNPSAQAAHVYAGPQGEVGVYLAYYRHQGSTRKLVSSVNALVRSSDTRWNQVSAGEHQTSVAGQQLRAHTARLLGTEGQGAARRPMLVAWRLYWIDGRWVASDAGAKLAGAFERLRGRGDDGAALVIHADSDSAAQATALLESFMQSNLGALESLLAQAREAR